MFSDLKVYSQSFNTHFRSSNKNLEDLDERERQRQDKMNIRYLQLLRALIHNQIIFVDNDLKEEGQDPALYRTYASVVCESVTIKVTIVASVSM